MTKNQTARKQHAATPTTLELVTEIINACADANGKDIRVLDVSESLGLADYFVVVSGRSDRQVLGITTRALEIMEKNQVSAVSVEGVEEGHWVLADFGDIILHVFYEPTRQHYDIEGLWSQSKKLEIISQKRGAQLEIRAA